ncbi:MAG: hypothetical protein F6K37_23780 [Moorea sp. SIO4E2]|uniref:hypothetical protein n=1 Tax=Moorena sp. SIO4E2 TaxID=2607826 RepID=UPI0013BE02E7|nr:hypothetical protein [Moorena sp. SIO4E2]NEQ08852.1 hypothetical protein [Moorena sp. SIO4E2]
MSDLNKIVYPTLDLFLYDLREGLGQDPEIIDYNRERFWQRIYGHPEGDESDLILEPTLLAKLKQAERSESRLVELLGADVVKHFERPLEGYYYPIQIGNTYALQVNCSGVYADGIRQSNHSPQPITNIKKIQGEILAHINHQPGAIGQTWIMWGQLCDRDQDPTQIALECYKQLVSKPDWSRDFQAQGKVLGGTLFEFWRPPADWSEPEAIKNNHHLLIWLFPKKRSIDSIIDSITGIYIDLIYLLYYRNKILWAYGEINRPLAELKADLVSVKTSIAQISMLPQNTLKLREILSNNLNLLSRYATNLGMLDSQTQTIKTNIEDYQQRLTKLKQVYQRSDWHILREFRDLAASQYLQQVEMDHGRLKSGLTLLENLIRTVDGMTQTYQTQSNRSLHQSIALAGVGVATSSITATVLVKQQPPDNNTIFILTPAFAWSLLTGAIATLLMWIILRLFGR